MFSFSKGELDDDEELEEGEVKEDSDSEMPENKPDSEDSSVKRPGPLLQEDRNVSSKYLIFTL